MNIGIRHFAKFCVVILLAGGAAAVANAQPKGAAAVDGHTLSNPLGDPGEWPGPGRTYAEWHYSPLAQINAGNVKQLGLAWYSDMETDNGVEASPLMIDGVLYNTQPWNITTAFDAKTGKVLWTYDPKVPREMGRLACCDVVSRGLSAWKGKIYIATLDGRLIALDAKTGQVVWSVQTLEKPWAYTITGAPRVFDGKVLIGNGGAENAARGYVSAYDANTGDRIWRFYLVPGNPAERATQAPNQQKADAISAPTWTGEWWKTGGGGTAWDSIVYDPKLKLVYIGGGNGGPWAQNYRSPNGGDNLFLSSIVAVKVDTGEYVWHYQTIPGDEWDYTATQPLMLADLKIDGKLRHVIMQAPKNGFFYVLDRATGKFISGKPFVPVTWGTVDPKTGKPTVDPAARYGEKPILLSPNAGGGHNWNPMAYSPKTGLIYFPVVQGWASYSVNPTFVEKPGETSNLGTGGRGYQDERKQQQQFIKDSMKAWLVAWDPVKQKEAWRVPDKVRGSGGILATAGNLIFQGQMDSTFAAFRADTGEKVWEMDAQQVPIAAPITYTIDGAQYIAVNAGWGGGVAHVGGVSTGMRLSKVARLLVFKLGGTASLPDLKVANAPIKPPPSTASAEVIEHGKNLYADTCAPCHGEMARGGIRDLRLMTPATHADFLNIVIGGEKTNAGMVSFANKLSTADAEAIHAYLIQRANEDWAEISAGH